MSSAQPLSFQPIFMPRVWGGRRLESLFGKELPGEDPIGEAWEIVDREDAQSVVSQGPLQGKTLHELWTGHRREIFGDLAPASPRFPLLVKLLDAREKLSLQVHPPAAIAPALGGEPKTEMWFIVENYGEGNLFAGLKRGVTREAFEQALASGETGALAHEIAVQRGDAIFIPSGRIHAIGAGNVIVEVQQNSDTTYRVFDWNRVGLDGKPRDLHIEESLASTDFVDYEPGLATPQGEVVVACEHFHVERWLLDEPREGARDGAFAIFTSLRGDVACGGRSFRPGEFFLLPACQQDRRILPLSSPAEVLRIAIPAPLQDEPA